MRSFHNVPTIFAFTVTFVILFNMSLAYSFWPCIPCSTDSECNAPPVDTCVWGETTDVCGRKVCAKGPGERCGGPLKMLGECGEGMMCKNDERCHGCSIQTLQCHP